MMKVDLRLIEMAIQKLFEYLRDNQIEQIVLEEDYYWNICDNDLYDVTKEPVIDSIGQLTCDYELLVKFVIEKNIPVARNFLQASALLRYLSIKITV